MTFDKLIQHCVGLFSPTFILVVFLSCALYIGFRLVDFVIMDFIIKTCGAEFCHVDFWMLDFLIDFAVTHRAYIVC